MKRIREIRRHIPQHWVGDGFPVRSLFAYHEGAAFDPFLLLDYAGPHAFPPGQARRGVGEHPHRGFETVTIVYQGELEHRDSSGSQGSIGPGDVQWMTAAAGVVHEEFHSERFTRAGGVLEMVQLWVNLPAKDKMSPPKYQAILDGQIPRVELPEGAGTARIIAGAFQGTTGPARTFTPIHLWDVQLQTVRPFAFAVPPGHTAILVVQRGAIHIGETPVKAVELVLFEEQGDAVQLAAQEPSRLLVLMGQPLKEPVVGQGPFVMNSRDEIRQALMDYQMGRMGHLGGA